MTRRSAAPTPPQRIDQAVDALRAVYRGGPDAGRALAAAIEDLHLVRPRAVSHQMEQQIEQTIVALRLVPSDIERRRPRVQEIAETLKVIRAELVAATQPVADTGKQNLAFG